MATFESLSEDEKKGYKECVDEQDRRFHIAQTCTKVCGMACALVAVKDHHWLDRLFLKTYPDSMDLNSSETYHQRLCNSKMLKIIFEEMLKAQPPGNVH